MKVSGGAAMPQLIAIAIVFFIIMKAYQTLIEFILYLKAIPFFGVSMFIGVFGYLCFILYRHYQKVAARSSSTEAEQVIKTIKAIERNPS